jgi:urease accessory protein
LKSQEIIRTNNLELRLKCGSNDRSIISHEYTGHPLRLSPIFRLDDANSLRAYLYIINSSPGLLAGDNLSISLQLEANTSLYLTDQAATKVHPMPQEDAKAVTNYQIEVGENSTLEFIPEPLIFYQDATLEQTIKIKLHSTARLFLSEIILPGRLARGEFYQFRYYFNRLQINSSVGELWFKEAMCLEGKLNPFKDTNLFASLPVLGNLIVILPQTNLKLVCDRLEDRETANCLEMIVASSILPHNKGVLVRAMASNTQQIKKYIKYALNCVRHFTNQSPLPYIPK